MNGILKINKKKFMRSPFTAIFCVYLHGMKESGQLIVNQIYIFNKKTIRNPFCTQKAILRSPGPISVPRTLTNPINQKGFISGAIVPKISPVLKETLVCHMYSVV